MLYCKRALWGQFYLDIKPWDPSVLENILPVQRRTKFRLCGGNEGNVIVQQAEDLDSSDNTRITVKSDGLQSRVYLLTKA